MAEGLENLARTSEENEINLLILLQVLVKRRLFICFIVFTSIALSCAYSLTLKNIYSATARILPPQKESSGGLSALLGPASGGLAALAAGTGLGGGSELYISILKSNSVMDDVIAKLDLMSKFKAKHIDIARRRLSGKVDVKAEKSGIISITANDRDPKLAAELANAFVVELGRTTVRLNLSKVGTERVFLEKRLESVKADLQRAEDELKSFAQRNKIVEVNSQAKASIEGIAKMKAEIASREVQLSVLRSYQTDESAEVKALLAGIKKLNAEMSKLAGSGSGGEGIPSIGNVPGVSLEYARRLREMKIQEAIFEQLTKQFELAKLNEEKDSSTVQVLDSATVPFYKSKPRRSIIVILAATTSFFFSIILAFIFEFYEKMSESDRQLIQDMKKQFLMLPRFRKS